MAVVKYKDFVSNNVDYISVDSRDNQYCIDCKSRTGKINRFSVPIPENLRVEINGNVSEIIEVCNCLTVFGNIKNAQVRNCVNIDGVVEDLLNFDYNRIVVNKQLKIEKTEKSSTRASVLRVNGDIMRVFIRTAGSVLVMGDCCSAIVANCLDIKGSISRLEVGNCVYSKKSIKASPRAIANAFNQFMGR